MCGRYTLINLAALTHAFPWIDEPLPDDVSRYNVAPTQPILGIANNHADRFEHFHWGFIPSWAKDPAIGSRMINARAETIAEKPAFRTALRRRRCLIPADGFYEWKKEPGGKTKTPMLIRMKSGGVFAFAGIWETWHSPDGSVLPSCTVITTQPNALMATIHDRMPVILEREHYQRWLDPKEHDAADLTDLLKPFPADRMAATPVSRAVNNPKNDSPACIESMTDDGKKGDSDFEQTLF
jgi:putative SOS response-associated peptidase YedK